VSRRLLISAWLGFALAALLFYPIAVALDADAYYLQWGSADAVETGAAIVVLAVLFGAAIFAIWPRPGRGSLIALAVVAVLPLGSFVAGLARQLPFDNALRAAGENRLLVLAVGASMAALLAVSFFRWPGSLERWLRRLVVLVSPVSLVVIESLISSAPRVSPAVASATVDPVKGTAAHTCQPVFALLFDELSFSYLYDEANQVRAEYPAIRAFASQATNYVSVAAPGPETLVSMPSYLAARHLRNIRVDGGLMRELGEGDSWRAFTADDGGALFPTARRLGFRTEMAGYYLPYCGMLGGLLDECQALSFYNVSAADDDFSLTDPILTTFVLWPRQAPFGLLKNPPFARLQRELVEHTTAFARRPLRGAQPVFRFVHFSVPHLPFVFSADGFDPPFDPLRTDPDASYARQLRYVDRLVDAVVRRLQRDGAYDTTTLVLLSDHGFRFGGREQNPLHIPFMVKKAGQRSRIEVTAPGQAESLLRDVVSGACQ